MLLRSEETCQNGQLGSKEFFGRKLDLQEFPVFAVFRIGVQAVANKGTASRLREAAEGRKKFRLIRNFHFEMISQLQTGWPGESVF